MKRWIKGVASGVTALALQLTLQLALQSPAWAFGLNSGGDTSVAKTGANAFSLPAKNLSFAKRLDFSVGNSFFRNPWVFAPSSTKARDGLGPLFNTNACQNCHIKDGRGHLPAAPEDNLVSALIRISVAPSSDADWELTRQQGVLPVPLYGSQLQDFAQPGITPEVKVGVEFEFSEVTLADGTKVSLRRPEVNIQHWAYGKPGGNVLFSIRVAPPVIGLGLLEAISDAQLEQFVQEQAATEDAVSGKLNQVFHVASQSYRYGRFGWKAEQPTVKQQNAAAFLGDMGLTSSLFPAENCPPKLTTCGEPTLAQPPEVSDKILDQVTFYTRHLGVPKRRNLDDPAVQQGEKLFVQAQCAACHLPSVTIAAKADTGLAGQQIHPYTDLLLHDMGPDLADNRPVFLASGSEWRTPPLWGIGLSKDVSEAASFLHDGRARTLLEAILWHGGEAERSKQQVIAMKTEDRDALLAFLNSL